MDQYSPTSLYSIAEEVTPQDHQILCHGGTTSTLERLPSRLRQSKPPTKNLKKRIEDLAYEVSYLKAEVSWHTESKQALLQFQEKMYQLFHQMEDALVQVNARMQDAEQRYLSLWGLTANANSAESVI
jgi:vacuolar-type H+-ATPase subunit I/STV1